MIDKLEALKERFEEVGQLIVQPDAMQDMASYTKLTKEYKDLQKVVERYEQYKQTLSGLEETKSILESEKDPELRELAKLELEELNPAREQLEEELKNLLIPKDPNDSKNVILEVRAGTGGDEAAIFAGDLFRLYQRFCEKNNLKLSVLDLTEGTAGGYKEIISTVSGEDVYGLLKFESGVHRVQRVPTTETQGRIHTSAASVAVVG